ncbi:MAG: aspartate aminotransferase family protein [Candidatus Sumerlaeaceae bacterium]
MISNRDLFLSHVGQTSPFGGTLDVASAAGCYIYDTSGKQYLDFIAGIAVCNVGHCHPHVVQAVQQQATMYAHTMVYGEHVQGPQVKLAAKIAEIAPAGLDTTYFLSTGAEANDAALKMAVKLTGRSGLVAFRGAYHGDTVGALACFGDDMFRRPFERLLAPVTFLDFGRFEDLEQVNSETAGVIIEPVQGEAGIRVPPDGFLQALRERCTATGALLIFDEVQTGFGRIGDWFAARHYNVTPDIITMAKGMGAGMPLAGVLASRDQITRFAADPPFSHITTFGGHPVSCAAAVAGIEVLEAEGLLDHTRRMGDYLLSALRKIAAKEESLLEVRGIGLMIGAQMTDKEVARQVVIGCKDRGLILETNLLDERVIRFSPPLVVTVEQCDTAVEIFTDTLSCSRQD